jgi:glutaconate CoA-transferase subunit A
VSKVARLEEAVALVGDGCELALCGFAINRNAIAAVAAIVAQGTRRLRLVQVVGGMETDILVGAGCVERLVYSGGSLDRFGPLHAVNRAIATGSVDALEYSTLSLTLRLFAGSLGLPFVPSRTLLGSELLPPLVAAGGAATIEDPFSGRPCVALPALRPEVAIVHANACDEEGNAVVVGPAWSIRETALAAERVIVTAERVVAAGTLEPGAVTIPGVTVAAVAEVPFGARPTAVFGAYDFDAAWFDEHVAASREGGDEFAAYLDKRVVGGWA